jgi:hypothetical protein
MASRNGNPKVTPTPLSTALREICFFVMNIYLASGACLRNASLLTIPKTIEDNL